MNTKLVDCYSAKNIDALLSKWNLASKKRWGQNFLVSEKICEQIANDAKSLISPQECNPAYIWEIGPGFAALTNQLLSWDNIHLTVFEIDFGLIKLLEHNIDAQALSNIQIIKGDAEQTLFTHALAVNNSSYIPQVICGNLPYSTGVRILISCSRISTIFNRHIPLCVMLQKESAQRLVSASGNKMYGLSSVLLQSMYTIRIVREVAYQNFHPKPNVESVICSFTPRDDVPVLTTEQFHNLKAIVHASFLQRRKKLSNTLLKFLQSKNVPNPMQLCEQVEISLDKRAETIDPDTYMKLALLIQAKL